MSLKHLPYKVLGKYSRHILTVKMHSPTLMFGAGIVGVTTTAVLACRATLKLSDVLDEAQKEIEDTQAAIDKHYNSVPDWDEKDRERYEKNREAVASSKRVKLQTAIKVVKLYAPAIVVGVASVTLLTGAHVVLKRRNAALASAYMAVDKSYKEYRKRVVSDQGEQKDFEYANGVTEREIVEEGPNGPETKIIKGVDPDVINDGYGSPYAKIFDELNENWSDIPNQNLFLLTSFQNQANDLLRMRGYVFLNDVYDMLGMDRTQAGSMVGWLKHPEKDENGNEKGDSYISFGVWHKGVYKGLEWLRHNQDGLKLDFNVDGVILHRLPKT